MVEQSEWNEKRKFYVIHFLAVIHSPSSRSNCLTDSADDNKKFHVPFTWTVHLIPPLGPLCVIQPVTTFCFKVGKVKLFGFVPFFYLKSWEKCKIIAKYITGKSQRKGCNFGIRIFQLEFCHLPFRNHNICFQRIVFYWNIIFFYYKNIIYN